MERGDKSVLQVQSRNDEQLNPPFKFSLVTDGIPGAVHKKRIHFNLQIQKDDTRQKQRLPSAEQVVRSVSLWQYSTLG